MKFIITESEKYRILDLYGLNKQFINEGLSDQTVFKSSGDGTTWIITYQASDGKDYPLSEYSGSEVIGFTGTFYSRTKANTAITQLKEKLKGLNKKKSTRSISGLPTDVPSGAVPKYTTTLPTDVPSGAVPKYTYATTLPTGGDV